MGGKHKQAQRIKNNARPSSSGRSAELLASSSQMPHLSSMREIRFVPPTISLMKTEDFDSSVPPDFQLALKKMNKKDSTTKIKALQEFSDLIANSENEAVKTILPFWATLYSILATDTDHRVREGAHNAHLQIILKDKKLIAPFLKQLIGPWFTSQYDTYPPAASTASKAFNAAFPVNKIQDCVIFCQKEILTYIYENITTKIDSNSKNEDFEAKFERIIISSLQGYCLYLETLTAEQIEKCLDLNRQIITNSKFLKLASHKTASIRGAWFKVLANLYYKAPFLLDGLHQQFVPIIFDNLDESEPTVVGFVWEAVLLVMELKQDWWQYINFEKNYLSKFKKILREGGQGNAAVIYPNLLSFLHKLPSALATEQFYDNFFENLRFGLKKKSVLNSKAESTAVVAALIECLQYIILNNYENVDLCEKLTKSHLLPLIEWSLKHEHVCYRTIFHRVTHLIQFWHRNKNYSQYLNVFWTNLANLFESVSNLSENQDLVERQLILIQNLKHIAKPKESKVKFTSESESRNDCDLKNELDESYNENLKKLVFVLIKSYVRQIQEKKSKILLENLLALVRLFEAKEFIANLSQNEDLLGIYRNLFYDWLKSEELCCEIVVDLSFVLLKYLNNEEKKTVLDTFLEFYGNECFSWCVKNAFSYPFNEDDIVRNWLKNSQVGEFLLEITDINLNGDCPPILKNLFKLAFTESCGELLIDKETLFKVILKLQTSLSHPENFTTSIDTCVHLASYVTDMIYTESSLLKWGDDLLLSLFQFSLKNHSNLEFLTEDTQHEVSTSWQDVITMLSKNLEKEELKLLIGKFAQLVEVMFLENAPVDNDLNRLREVVVQFIRAVFLGQPMFINDVFQTFFVRDFLPTWKSKIEELFLSAEYLNGCFADCDGVWRKISNSVSEENIMKYFCWSLIKLSVLTSPVEEEEDTEENTESTEVFYIIDDNDKLVADLLYDLALCQSFLTYYKTAKHFMDINQRYEMIKNKTSHIIEKLQIQNDLKNLLVHKSNDSFIWCKTAFLFHQQLQSDCAEDIYKEYSKLVRNNSSKLHFTQLYGKFIDFDNIDQTSSTFENIVILRSLAHCNEIEVQIAEVFERIKKFRSQDIPKFLFDNKYTEWGDSETVIETIRLFSTLIKDKFDCLSRQHWDFGVISLSSWASNCNKLRANFDNLQIQAFMISICDFYIILKEKMLELKSQNIKNSFVEEWEDLFLPNIHNDLLQIWIYLADQFTSKNAVSIEFQPFLQEIGKISDNFNHNLIFNKDSNMPNWNKILKRCTNLLVNSSVTLQLWGYKMLLVLIMGLKEIDLNLDSSSTPNTKGFTIEQFKEVLQETHCIVDGVLAGFKLGEDSCQVTPYTDSYTYIFAYLLLWGVLLNLCEKSPPELRYQYADWLRNDNYFKFLLNNLFKLMPTEVLHYNEGRAKAFTKLFLQEPNLTFKEPCTSEQIEHIVCWIYTLCLTQLPALVRQWWSETETKVTQIVERVTSFYVSPQLCNQELSDVGRRENNFKNMTIKIIPSVREVVAVYTVDEAQMELVITLPPNYPLGGPDVRCNRQIGGPQHKQWLMQLKKYLLHQNGRVWDGLALWNSSLDKKFDGVEECYICFAVLHPGTYQLPKLTCGTCKKKFHSACLYKWFSTSNKSSCPICRNLF